MLFWSGAPGTPDLCSSSAADPGDHSFSKVTSTIDEMVTLLKERICILTVYATALVHVQLLTAQVTAEQT